MMRTKQKLKDESNWTSFQKDRFMGNNDDVPRQSLKNHPSGHLGGQATLWSVEKMLDGQRQRVDIPAPARIAYNGLPQKRIEEDLLNCPLWPSQSRDWTELLMASVSHQVDCRFSPYSALSFVSSLRYGNHTAFPVSQMKTTRMLLLAASCYAHERSPSSWRSQKSTSKHKKRGENLFSSLGKISMLPTS